MDFFGEGINEENCGIKFSPEQQAFFNNKLLFLDPDNKKQILMGQAVSLLKFSGLSPMTQKKILDNLKLTGKSALDYTEMKKVLRGVALAQDKKQPLLVYINANIKTKMPKFYDDDEDDEQQQEQPKPVSQPQSQQRTVNSPPTSTKNVPTQQMTQSPQNIPPTSSHSQQQHTSNNLKKYEQFWGTLTTEDNYKISGGQVKRLFGNHANRKQLSKIWKLCNHTYKGSLTKGQLYIFMILMKSNPESIPSSLTPEMKAIIQKLDAGHNKGHHDENKGVLKSSHMFGEHNDSQNLQKSKSAIIKKNFNQTNRKSADFDDFANFSMQDKKKPTSQTQQMKPTHHPPRPQPQTTQRNYNQQASTSIVIPKQIHKISPQALGTVHQASQNQLRNLSQKVIPQLNLLSQQNRESNRILQQTTTFLASIEKSHQVVANKIAQLKENQDNLNYRLNQTCIRMRDVIVKQSQFIAQLMDNYNAEIEMNKQRVGVLSNYVQNVTGQLNEKIQNYSNQATKKQQNKNKIQVISKQNIENHQEQMPSQSPKYGDNYKKSLQSMKEMSMSMSVKRKQNLGSVQSNDSHQRDIAPNYQQQLREKLRQQQMRQNSVGEEQEEDSGQYNNNFAKQEYNNNGSPDKVVIKHTQQYEITQNNQNQQQNHQKAIRDPPSQNQQVSETNEQEESALRLRKKQIFTVQMINFLAPIKQQQYPIILQRVTSMTQNQLDALYAQLYKKYQLKMEQEKKKQTAQTQKINPPTNDEFSTNNFKKYEVDMAPKNKHEEDFFAQ